MKSDENKWIENILGSTKGSERAKPSAKVWVNIEQQVFKKETHLVSISQWRVAAIAAVLLIALNIFSIRHYLQNRANGVSEMTTENRPNQSIISNYQLYD